MSIDKAIRSAVAPMRRALWRTIRRGIVKLTDTAAMLQIEGYDGERTSDVDHWQHYGMASRPPAGVEALVLQVGGETEQPIAIAESDAECRPADIADGETVLYGRNCIARMRANGDIDIIPWRDDTDGAGAASDSAVHIGGDRTQCTEPIIRGNEFLTDLLSVLTEFAGHYYTGTQQAAAATSVANFAAKHLGWKSELGFVEEKPGG